MQVLDMHWETEPTLWHKLVSNTSAFTAAGRWRSTGGELCSHLRV